MRFSWIKGCWQQNRKVTGMNPFNTRLITDSGRIIWPSLLLVLVTHRGLAQEHTISQEINNTSGWFGGNNSQTGFSPRNVGIGQSVLIDSAITLARYLP